MNDDPYAPTEDEMPDRPGPTYLAAAPVMNSFCWRHFDSTLDPKRRRGDAPDYRATYFIGLLSAKNWQDATHIEVRRGGPWIREVKEDGSVTIRMHSSRLEVPVEDVELLIRELQRALKASKGYKPPPARRSFMKIELVM